MTYKTLRGTSERSNRFLDDAPNALNMSSRASDCNQCLREELNRIIQTKKRLAIKMEHWERIRRITKNARELREIDRTLAEMRMEFLKFGEKHF